MSASAGGILDEPASWPEHLHLMLRDFTYDRLFPLGDGERLGQLRHASWYIAWLGRDSSKSFQPYWQLAQVLRAHGKESTAHEVLIAGRERQRLQLPWWNPERWWLWLLRWIIGYGYGAGELLALLWAIPFLLAGAILAWFKTDPEPEGRRRSLWYSFDMLVPGMWLDESHARVAPLGRWRWYFYVHRLVGYLLLLFVVAGLAGLTE